MEFVFGGDHHVGVFGFLRSSSEYNILDEIVVSNSSLYPDNNRSPYYPFGIGTDGQELSWHSLAAENSWLQVSFKRYYLKLNSYSLRAWDAYPQNWDLEGRTDHTEWRLIHSPRDDSSLSGKAYSNFFVNNEEHFSFFRITMRGKRNGGNDFCFELFHFELFGLFYPIHPNVSTTQQICTCQHNIFAIYPVIDIHV